MAENPGADSLYASEKSRRKSRLPLMAGALACASALAMIGQAEARVSSPAILPKCNNDKAYRSYSFAGEMWWNAKTSISATITELSEPNIKDGHVAALIDIGGPHPESNDNGDWLQVGIADGKVLHSEMVGAEKDSGYTEVHQQIYYEVARDGVTKYIVLGSTAIGQPVRFTLKEMASAPDHWKIFVDGKQKAPAVLLRGSHGNNYFSPFVISESWGGGNSQHNTFDFGFKDITVAGMDGRRVSGMGDASLCQDSGYKLAGATTSHFRALSK